MEFIIGIIIIAIVLALVFYGAVFFILAVAYGYWGLSIVIAPVLCILLVVGLIIGLICAVKNAIKAMRIVQGKVKQ